MLIPCRWTPAVNHYAEKQSRLTLALSSQRGRSAAGQGTAALRNTPKPPNNREEERECPTQRLSNGAPQIERNLSLLLRHLNIRIPSLCIVNGGTTLWVMYYDSVFNYYDSVLLTFLLWKNWALVAHRERRLWTKRNSVAREERGQSEIETKIIVISEMF